MVFFTKKETLILFAIFVVIFLATFGSRNYRLYNESALKSESHTDIYLEDRADLETLAEILEKSGTDFDRDELIWAGRVLGWRFFRPGLYKIDGTVSYSDFLSKLARGIQDAASVTILSGIDPERLSMQLSRQLRADSSSFIDIFRDSSDLSLELNLTGDELFSRMLPNTYQIYWTSTPENVVKRVHGEFERSIVSRYQNEIEESRYSISEIVILASIVELEARVPEEKPKIAGLYLNRLNRRMLLQADPTVIYAIGERRRLLFEDYRFEHPYNTYIISGLPPGPITNADEASIRAVLEPEEHDYLFMVATPDGSHRFSRTFDEHRQASAEWRRWIQEQYRIRDQREREEAANQSE